MFLWENNAQNYFSQYRAEITISTIINGLSKIYKSSFLVLKKKEKKGINLPIDCLEFKPDQ